MPLNRGRVMGYDAKHMSFEFTMMTADARSIQCSVSSTALDVLSGEKGVQPGDRTAQFEKLRDRIESVASDIFDIEPCNPVRVFAKHVDSRKDLRGQKCADSVATKDV